MQIYETKRFKKCNVELALYKNYATDFLNYSEGSIEKLLEKGDIFKLEKES